MSAPMLMCECSHHWTVHAESGQTAPSAVCHGYTGSATPGPLREPCRCSGFKPWPGPWDARTGEAVKPLTVAIDARVKPAEPLPDAAITAAFDAWYSELFAGITDDECVFDRGELWDAWNAGRAQGATAERARIAAVIRPASLRLIADGIERDDELHQDEPAELMPGGKVTDWLRRAADLLDGDGHGH